MGLHWRVDYRHDTAALISSLAHLARRLAPGALVIAGGMEANLQGPSSCFRLGPFDRVVLGEGERPATRAGEGVCRSGESLLGVTGTVERTG